MEQLCNLPTFDPLGCSTVFDGAILDSRGQAPVIQKFGLGCALRFFLGPGITSAMSAQQDAAPVPKKAPPAVPKKAPPPTPLALQRQIAMAARRAAEVVTPDDLGNHSIT